VASVGSYGVAGGKTLQFEKGQLYEWEVFNNANHPLHLHTVPMQIVKTQEMPTTAWHMVRKGARLPTA
jgi:FtsP/CotA-like multicopper oxidase with cupredoxin domain